MFVRLSYLHARFSSTNFHPFLSFQTSNFHSCSSCFLETSSVRLDLFTFDLLAHASGFKIMEKMSYSLVLYPFHVLSPTQRASKCFKMKKEGSQVQLLSRVLNLVLSTGFYILALEDGTFSYTCDLSMCKTRWGPYEETDADSYSARVLYVYVCTCIASLVRLGVSS